ncbi:hypothetical protein M5X11_17255 [Paenibacillus alginolyticus]|uniref:Uncharacterized protein n=1 Tax=Paenibacillus alginolyticus TaxID=59839 RepID=A0ABT4GDM2_9BACL|nr:hypothetical protein [Paenibacillus alginolyticus]MCY9666652.1 hypothetical protein [Paenibacillus alginolyticus]MCY9694158.1 hypothetical protein [Paenibacillus alginolyticus]MEC0142373.1 hypothetical protein [Paenibacillus alginolyticus]
MEFMPPVSNPYMAAQQSESGALHDTYTQQSYQKRSQQRLWRLNQVL